jgi:serine/threonine-protein kinase RsbW
LEKFEMRAESIGPMNRRASDTPSATPQIFLLTFKADPHSVRGALRAAVARFRRQITTEEAGTLELVLAEVMNNVVEHSYGDSGLGAITLSIVRDSFGLSCSVSDDGSALPSACLNERSLPSIDCDPENLPEGGFGWYLIRDLTRDLGYRRNGSCNLLAFRLPLSTASGPDQFI